MSLTAALMASSASILQCSFTGGRLRCLAMSLFLIVSTSSIDLPFTLQDALHPVSVSSSIMPINLPITLLTCFIYPHHYHRPPTC